LDPSPPPVGVRGGGDAAGHRNSISTTRRPVPEVVPDRRPTGVAGSYLSASPHPHGRDRRGAEARGAGWGELVGYYAPAQACSPTCEPGSSCAARPR
jgi:hypothetical protein